MSIWEALSKTDSPSYSGDGLRLAVSSEIDMWESEYLVSLRRRGRRRENEGREKGFSVRWSRVVPQAD